MEQKRSDEIAHQLEDLILTGRFASGDRLDENSLATYFGVSRTPIREAFQKLGISGLVEQFPRRGVFVCQPGPVELMEMFEVMAEFEATCGRLAARRISDEALGDLQAANESCMLAVHQNDTETYYSENERFHHIIYSQSGNGFLEQETKRLHRRLKPFRRLQLQLRGRLAQSMNEHQLIVQALRNGDAVKAAKTLRNHVAVQGEKFHHLLTSLKPAAE